MRRYYTDREKAFVDKAYSLTQSISIDNGVMEKAENVYVVLSDFGWSDLGRGNRCMKSRTKTMILT